MSFSETLDASLSADPLMSLLYISLLLILVSLMTGRQHKRCNDVAFIGFGIGAFGLAMLFSRTFSYAINLTTLTGTAYFAGFGLIVLVGFVVCYGSFVLGQKLTKCSN